MSFGRISTDDTSGKLRADVGDGYFSDDSLNTFGTRALASFGLDKNARTWPDYRFGGTSIARPWKTAKKGNYSGFDLENSGLPFPGLQDQAHQTAHPIWAQTSSFRPAPKFFAPRWE